MGPKQVVGGLRLRRRAFDKLCSADRNRIRFFFIFFQLLLDFEKASAQSESESSKDVEASGVLFAPG